MELGLVGKNAPVPYGGRAAAPAAVAPGVDRLPGLALA